MSFPDKVIGSVVKVDAYKNFLREPLNRAILYLLLVSVVFSGISSIKHVLQFSQGVNEMINEFVREVPDFELSNGRLHVDGEMPLFIEQDEDFIFVVDTSGTLDRSVLNDVDEGIFISEHEAVRKSGFETTSYQFSDFSAVQVTKSSVQNWLPLLKWFNVLIVVFGFAFYVIGKLLSALVVSLVGLIVESMVNYKVGFANLYKLSIYALTLPMILQLVLNLTDITIPSFWILYYGIALIYIWKALQLMRSSSENVEIEDI